MDDGVAAYATWSDVGATQRDADFRAYAFNIAEARYVMRRVTRIESAATRRSVSVER